MITVGLTACGKSESKPVQQAKVEAPKPNWVDQTFTDKMSGKVTTYVESRSIDSVSMKFPYQGGSFAEITVFDDSNVRIDITKGQVMCTSYSGCHISVKFDDEKPISFAAVGPSNGQSGYVHLTNGKWVDNGGSERFVKKLQTAKKVMISLEVYQENWPVWEFKVEGFVKPTKTK
jgi:hypothetical protein